MFADQLSAADDSGMGSIKNMFGSLHCLTRSEGGYLEVLK